LASPNRISTMRCGRRDPAGGPEVDPGHHSDGPFPYQTEEVILENSPYPISKLRRSRRYYTC
jgi:hypothetical protein